MSGAIGVLVVADPSSAGRPVLPSLGRMRPPGGHELNLTPEEIRVFFVEEEDRVRPFLCRASVLWATSSVNTQRDRGVIVA
jgi:hypothetical protein